MQLSVGIEKGKGMKGNGTGKGGKGKGPTSTPQYKEQEKVVHAQENLQKKDERRKQETWQPTERLTSDHSKAKEDKPRKVASTAGHADNP